MTANNDLIYQVRNKEKESLQLELTGIETLLQVIEDQQARSVTPSRPSRLMITDAKLLSKRAGIIRKLLKID